MNINSFNPVRFGYLRGTEDYSSRNSSRDRSESSGRSVGRIHFRHGPSIEVERGPGGLLRMTEAEMRRDDARRAQAEPSFFQALWNALWH